MEKYRTLMSHLIDGKQVNKHNTFWAGSREKAQKKFQTLRRADKTIQEAVLYRIKDDSVVDEYTGYI